MGWDGTERGAWGSPHALQSCTYCQVSSLCSAPNPPGKSFHLVNNSLSQREEESLANLCQIFLQSKPQWRWW